MKYRPEVDGLRSIAVLPVILFHAGFSTFSGGYVGVDVFFVISGYLITTILLSEMEQGKFSLVTFYERRARRILPALFFVMLVSTFVAFFALSPAHMLDFSESLVAISIFSSNILFWQETGYWGVENELKPLLHTWSLAVEEQYYVLFPLFLMAMWKFRKRWIFSSFLIIAFISFLLSQYLSSVRPTANFFLLPTRGWELAIGSVIAFYFLYRPKEISTLLSNNFVDEFMGFLGILLITFSIFFYDESTPFPGVYALIPTIGTGFVIVFANQQTIVGKILSSRILVGIGLISYSAYLWHQPIFAFARHLSVTHPSKWTFLFLSVLSLVLAALTWKYIEAPFRNKSKFKRAYIFKFSLTCSLVFILVGMFGHSSDGMKFRFESDYLKQIESAKRLTFGKHLCEGYIGNDSSTDEFCVLAKSESKFAFLYGDSHADALMLEAKKTFQATKTGLIFSSMSACPPVTGVYRKDQSKAEDCVQHNLNVYNFLINHPQIEYVILTARWTLGIEGVRFDNQEGGVESGRKPHLDVVQNGEYAYHETYNHRELLANAYKESIEKLLNAGKKVILVYPVPEAGWDVPDYIFKSYVLDRDSTSDERMASTSYEVYKQRNRRAINALDSVGEDGNLLRVMPEMLFCDSVVRGRCITHNNGIIFYRDDDHVSDFGAKLIMEEVINYIN